MLVCLLLLAPRLCAWNAEGHMVVAQLAYNHLDSVVKTRCDALIAVPLTNASAGTSNFVTAAVWADDFKTALGTGIWHYLDIPFSLDGTATNGVSSASFDVVRAINQCVATLQNTSAAATNRATCLRYLLHLVGDIQQPLHCCTAVYVGKTSGDSGGNGFTLTGAAWSNLHSLWDDGGGFLGDTITRPFTTNSFAMVSNKVAVVETNYPFVSNPGVIPDPMTWAVEGKNLGQSNAYAGIVRGSAPTTNYLDATIALTKARMALGGQRLADLLNTLFAPMPVALTPQTIASNTFIFSWSASPSKTYRVQWKAQLTAAAWNDLPDVLAATNSVAYTNAVGATQRFYRVVGVD
ncbi:MAG: hypothetical protein RLZZ350_1324 [Verrucomicrobiota bacterium]